VPDPEQRLAEVVLDGPGPAHPRRETVTPPSGLDSRGVGAAPDRPCAGDQPAPDAHPLSLSVRRRRSTNEGGEDGAKTARGIIQRLAKEPWTVDRHRGLREEVPVDTVKSRLKKCNERGLGLLIFDGSGRAGALPGPNLFDEPTTEEQS
jgi:hypothetical protein